MSLSFENFLLIILTIFGFATFIFVTVFFLLELLMREKQIDSYVEEENIKNLVKKFHKKLDLVSNQKTNEILECLREMEELDSIYYVIVDNGYGFISEEDFIKTKSEILSDIINDKISHINKGKNRKEKFKSLLDEINGCQKRYPLYKNVYVKFIKIIKEKI